VGIYLEQYVYFYTECSSNIQNKCSYKNKKLTLNIETNKLKSVLN